MNRLEAQQPLEGQKPRAKSQERIGFRLRTTKCPGFTLVELLVVVMIIGILVGILLPALGKVKAAVRRAECVNILRQLGIAFHACADSTGELPKSNQWCFQVLPFLEDQTPVVSGRTGDFQKYLDRPVRSFHCPARNASDVRVDYAASDQADSALAIGNFADMTAGASNVIMLAEKRGAEPERLWPTPNTSTNANVYISDPSGLSGNAITSWDCLAAVADDRAERNEPIDNNPQSIIIGRLTTALVPVSYFGTYPNMGAICGRAAISFTYAGSCFQVAGFGSAHATSMNALRADGSVSAIPYGPVGMRALMRATDVALPGRFLPEIPDPVRVE